VPCAEIDQTVGADHSDTNTTTKRESKKGHRMKRSTPAKQKSYVYVGRTEIKALIVGLVTGVLYGALNLPIPAPNVLGGNLAILFTFVGLVIIGLFRHEMTLGRPPAGGDPLKNDRNSK